MGKYEVILIDADDTLFDFGKAEAHALQSVLREIGVDLEADGDGPESYTGRYLAINAQLWKDLEAGLVTTSQLRQERFRRLLDGDTKIALHPDAVSNRYLELLGEGAFLLEGAAALCKELAAKARVAVVTNGIKDVQINRIARSGLADCFEQVIVSEDTGFQKPQTGIFDHTFGKLGIRDKHNVLMVGDSLTSDIKGGNNYGIDTCWYNPSGKPNTTDIRPTYEIRSYTELLALL
ncbi:YjjG family noncanonical pyrimidine nucleotidase [Paenibacillus sp. NPDC058071]|uniref:YjjG family noncanonical pyrimidine nucleotidase n=1 Tax=Paenibacillus sp. NPDC058071 TaxID=3346326 RepID=UPI0036DC2CEE